MNPVVLLCVAFALFLAVSPANALLNITKYNGVASNSYVLNDNTSSLLIDCSFYGSPDPSGIISLIASLNKTLQAVYITHAHPDHYSGLVTIMQTYNSTPVYVATAQIKADIVANVAFLGTAGVFNTTVTSFPWNNTLQLLPNPALISVLSENLTVDTNIPMSEADHPSVVYYNGSQALFAGDMIYVNSHLYLGVNVDGVRVNNWISILGSFPSRYPGANVFPGHGGNSTNITFTCQDNVGYLQYFLQQLCVPGYNLTNVSNALLARYPNYTGSNVLSFLGQNPAWPTYQQQNCTVPTTAAPTTAAPTTAVATTAAPTTAVATTASVTTAASTTGQPATTGSSTRLLWSAPLLVFFVAVVSSLSKW